MSPILATNKAYTKSKRWLEVHPIVPTALAVFVAMAMVLLYYINQSGIDTERAARQAADDAKHQTQVQIITPLCKVVDRYALATDANISQETVDVWYAFGHVLGCPKEMS